MGLSLEHKQQMQTLRDWAVQKGKQPREELSGGPAGSAPGNDAGGETLLPTPERGQSPGPDGTEAASGPK